MHLASLKNIWLFAGAGLFFLQCQSPKTPTIATNSQNEEIRLNLNQTVNLNRNLGEITFSHLDDSRCPANAMCVRQGAAIASFTIRAKNTEEQIIRLFIGDFMDDDPRHKRNQTADTVAVQLSNNNYILILKEITPYPGTSEEAPKASLILKRP